MRTVVILQARMGSTRLPGKVLTEIGGRTMLDRAVTRLRRTRNADEVVVATSVLAADDAIEEHGAELGVRVVRGDALDVLARYVDAARATDADIVVRATSDCPFVDPSLTAAVIDALTADPGPVDYASNAMTPRTFPRGLDVEALTAAALFDADANDRDPGSREHVTPYVRESGRFRVRPLVNDEDLSELRWTVDTAEDLAVARAMAAAFDNRDDVPWTGLLRAWRAHPEWGAMNAHVEQKEVEKLGSADRGDG